MRFAVRTVYRRGRPLTGREISNVTPIEGEMRLLSRWDEERKRLVQLVSLHADVQGMLQDRLLPDLCDAVLVGMVQEHISLTGFEVVDGVEYRQSWIARIAVSR